MDLTGEAGGHLDPAKENLLPAPCSIVDPFLVEALQTPRHRLTILRMELDIQKFLHNDELRQFEFPHFPTSYLRLAAHRVAQHYDLQTIVLDNVGDGQGTRILVMKKPNIKYPIVCLSGIPGKDSENRKLDQSKIVVMPRPKAPSSCSSSEPGCERRLVRTVEERKEDYDRARARIFSPLNNAVSEDISANSSNEASRNLHVDGDKSIGIREIGNPSKVAILRDRQKDLTDPDYDRSYDRYIKSIPGAGRFSVGPFDTPNFQPQFVQYDYAIIPQLGPMATPQASTTYINPLVNPFGATESNQTSFYMHWPMQPMAYAHSYTQLGPAFLQASFCQQPLEF